MKLSTIYNVFNLLFIIALTLVPSQSQAEISNEVYFQSILFDENGAVMPDGQYTVTFSLWDGDQETDVKLWEEQQSVSVENGIYGASLGSVVSFTDPNQNGDISDAITFAIPYFLGVKIDGHSYLKFDGKFPGLKSVMSAFRSKSSAGHLVKSVSTSYSLTENDDVVFVLNNSTVSLPSAKNCSGRVFTIKNVDPTYDTSVVTVDNETIDNVNCDPLNSGTPFVLTEQYDEISIISNGQNWMTLGLNKNDLQNQLDQKLSANLGVSNGNKILLSDASGNITTIAGEVGKVLSIDESGHPIWRTINEVVSYSSSVGVVQEIFNDVPNNGTVTVNAKTVTIEEKVILSDNNTSDIISDFDATKWDFEDVKGTITKFKVDTDNTSGHFEIAVEGNDSDTVLLIHSETIDDSQVFTDSSVGGSTHIMSVNSSDVHHETTNAHDPSNFGATSIQFDGSGDYLSSPDSNDWNFSTNDFTIDFWMRLNAEGQGVRRFVCGQADNTANYLSAVIEVSQNNKIRVSHNQDYNKEFDTVLSANIWYHIAVVRSSGTVSCYINGTKETTTYSMPGDIDSPDIMSIGRAGAYGSYYFYGFLDEFRISKGVARWNSNFPLPTSGYLSTEPVTIGPGNTESRVIESVNFKLSGDENIYAISEIIDDGEANDEVAFIKNDGTTATKPTGTYTLDWIRGAYMTDNVIQLTTRSAPTDAYSIFSETLSLDSYEVYFTIRNVVTASGG